jgi:GT2 family glycosyltransferase
MTITVVIRSKDEADRLRLTLTSLACQAASAEIIVVDDGSSDRTPQVIAQARRTMSLTAIRHDQPRGRAAAANAGARAASRDILVFLDGDTLAGPGFVAAHEAAHARNRTLCGRGETYHIRQTRLLLDPEAGTPQPGQAERLARLPAAERAAMKVTRQQIAEDFAAIDRRASPGVYPGAGPRALYELEIAALRDHPDCTVLWMAASGSNLSVRRDAFLAHGGFDETLGHIIDHREMPLRLCQSGCRMGFVPGARSYHLIHRSGWTGADPLQHPQWDANLYRRHRLPEVRLLVVLWASLADPSPVPPAARILSLPALELAARGETGIDYEAVRRAIPGFAAHKDSDTVVCVT